MTDESSVKSPEDGIKTAADFSPFNVLHSIATVKWREWEDGMNTPENFIAWARNIATHALELAASPVIQSEPKWVMEPPYDLSKLPPAVVQSRESTLPPRPPSKVYPAHGSGFIAYIDPQDFVKYAEAIESALTAERAQVEHEQHHRKVSTEAERMDCVKALTALAGAYIVTPAETYGTNSSWAISDLCRAVTSLAAQVEEMKQQETPEKAWERGFQDAWKACATITSSILAPCEDPTPYSPPYARPTASLKQNEETGA